MKLSAWCVVVLVFLCVVEGSLLEPLSSQPHIQCSACLAIAEHVGHKMNESAKMKSSFQASHRLDARNKVKRIDYESSELRAHEILDGLCNEVEKEYQLRMSDNGLRTFSKNKTLPRADYYGKNDRKELKSISKRFKDICLEITEERDEIVINVIKTLRELDDVQKGLCYSDGFKCCGTKKAEESRAKERDRRAKWLELKEAKEAKQRLKEEREKKRKEATEAAKKAAEEAAKQAAETEQAHQAAEQAAEQALKDADTASQLQADSESSTTTTEPEVARTEL